MFAEKEEIAELRVGDSKSLEFKVLDELRHFLGHLAEEERILLKRNMIKAGRCLQTGYVFKTKDGLVLGDGFHRRDICEELDYPFEAKLFNDDVWSIQEIKIWMINNQLGRRSYPHALKAYYIGLVYVLAVGPRGGDQTQGRVNHAKRLAVDYGVTEKSIENYGRLTRQVHSLAEIVQKAFHARKLTIKDVAQLSELPHPTQEQVIWRMDHDTNLKVEDVVEQLDADSRQTTNGGNQPPCRPPANVEENDQDDWSDIGEQTGGGDGEEEDPTDTEVTVRVRDFADRVYSECPNENRSKEIEEALRIVMEEWCQLNGEGFDVE